MLCENTDVAKVLHKLEAEEAGAPERDMRVAGEVAIDLKGEEDRTRERHACPVDVGGLSNMELATIAQLSATTKFAEQSPM